MDFSIEGLKDSDVEATLELFCRSIDDIHQSRPQEEREHLKKPYEPKKVRKRLSSENCVYLVVKEDRKIIGYMFAWATEGVGHIHWFYIDREYRKRGYGRKLLERTLKEFERHRCYESRIFIYPEDAVTCRFLAGLGYLEKARIEEQYFGVNLLLMVKPLEVRPRVVAKRIVLAGEAGQGIKAMAHALANILAKMGKEVTMNVLYDATVRGGEITAEIVFSDEKVEVPFFEKADIYLQLAKTTRRPFEAERQIVEASVSEKGAPPESATVPFQREAIEKFGSPLFINMIALGRLLHDIGIPIDKVDFRAELPARFLDENIRAIKYGYTYQD